MSRAPLNVPLSAAKKTPLCIHCKFYIPPNHRGLRVEDKKLGFCQKSGIMSVIDGEIEYKNVQVVREYDCKGSWFEQDPKIEVNQDEE